MTERQLGPLRETGARRDKPEVATLQPCWLS